MSHGIHVIGPLAFTLCCSLALAADLAQEPPQSLSRDLGRDSLADIRLTPRGCWAGLLGSAPSSGPPRRRPLGEATVEVWDTASLEATRGMIFTVYLDTLRQRLSRALEAPPPGHAAIELGELMLADPGNPQKLDITRVKSMQERYNRLPPSGSPVK